MDRMACINVEALPLQLLLRRNPAWTAKPVVVVDNERPQGVVLWANRHARAGRIQPGMRFAAGLALSRELRGGTVPECEIAESVAAITQGLWRFSPRIEPSEREPGTFWLDASGLRHLYPTLEVWARLIVEDLREAGFHSVAAVGFSRFGCYAAARSSPHSIVFADLSEERAYLRKVPIDRLGFTPTARDTLFKLGIETLGGFIDLPAGSIRRRFGTEADEMYCLARNDGWTSLAARPLFEAVERTLSLDYPETDQGRLLELMTGVLPSMLRELSERHEALAAFRFSLRLDDNSVHDECVSSASPTLDANQVLALARLRLEAVRLRAGVLELTLRADGVSAAQWQTELFQDRSHEQVNAAQEALAAVRAKLGNDAVVCARLHDGHLPEGRYAWVALGALAAPRPREIPMRPLVRRIFLPAAELPPRDRHEPDGWLIAGVSEGPVEEVIGPQILSGGWWMREITRTYHYVRTRSGRWLWIYYDAARRRWYLQGEVQ